MTNNNARFVMPDKAAVWQGATSETWILDAIAKGILTPLLPGSVDNPTPAGDLIVTKPFAKNWPNAIAQGDVVLHYPALTEAQIDAHREQPNNNPRIPQGEGAYDGYYGETFEFMTQDLWDNYTNKVALPFVAAPVPVPNPSP